MKHAYLPEYGHARCPHCLEDFDLSTATPTFREAWPSGDVGIYIMCPPCHGRFHAGCASRRKGMAKLCSTHFKLQHADSKGNPYPWAVATALGLTLVGGDLVRLSEHGPGVNLSMYERIRDGGCQAVVPPGGTVVIVADGG
jgi:hypothetical protein